MHIKMPCGVNGTYLLDANSKHLPCCQCKNVSRHGQLSPQKKSPQLRIILLNWFLTWCLNLIPHSISLITSVLATLGKNHKSIIVFKNAAGPWFSLYLESQIWLGVIGSRGTLMAICLVYHPKVTAIEDNFNLNSLPSAM